jgi:hypothetical protein
MLLLRSLLISCAAIVFAPLLSDGWEFITVWDDDGNFFKNDMVAGLSPAHLWAMLTQSYIKVYEPLSFFEKAVAIAIFPAERLPQLYRAFGVLCHLVAAVQLARCSALLLQIIPEASHIQPWALQTASCLAALAYAIHPLNMEIVGWPSAVPYAPAALFAFASGIYIVRIPVGYLSLGPIENKMMVFVTSACARRTGAASQAFERMHNTLSHMPKT